MLAISTMLVGCPCLCTSSATALAQKYVPRKFTSMICLTLSVGNSIVGPSPEMPAQQSSPRIGKRDAAAASDIAALTLCSLVTSQARYNATWPARVAASLMVSA